MVCVENGIIDGCQILHSALTLKAINLLKEEQVRESLNILEETFESQVKKLRNCETHPFLE